MYDVSSSNRSTDDNKKTSKKKLFYSHSFWSRPSRRKLFNMAMQQQWKSTPFYFSIILKFEKR